MSTRRHLPDGLPDHRARATQRGECSVIANHTPNGTTPNTTRKDTPSPPPSTPTRHHAPRARHQGPPPTPQPPSSPDTTTTTTRQRPPTTSPTTPFPPAALAMPTPSTPPSAPHQTCHIPKLHTTHTGNRQHHRPTLTTCSTVTIDAASGTTITPDCTARTTRSQPAPNPKHPHRHHPRRPDPTTPTQRTHRPRSTRQHKPPHARQ